jgi:hypothetical protein
VVSGIPLGFRPLPDQSANLVFNFGQQLVTGPVPPRNGTSLSSVCSLLLKRVLIGFGNRYTIQKGC